MKMTALTSRAKTVASPQKAWQAAAIMKSSNVSRPHVITASTSTETTVLTAAQPNKRDPRPGPEKALQHLIPVPYQPVVERQVARVTS